MAPEPQDQAETVIYANWVRTVTTPYDLALDLGYRTGPAPPERFPVRIIMSWEHAKDLQALLGAAVSEYEKEVGGIRDFGGVVASAQPEDDE
jgi:Protein of unknown function (DUF3467)